MAEKITKEELAEAERQVKVWKNREARLASREKYYRSAKDRKRTHRLIQYGAVIEHFHKELEVLSDVEIYELVESMMDCPDIAELIDGAVSRHDAAEEGGS